MSILSWLWPKSQPCNCEIERLKSTIAEDARAIEATQPIVDEAKRRSEDGIYRMRTKAGIASRRVEYEGALLRDLGEGWGQGHG